MLFHGETVDQGQQEVLAVDKSEIMAEEFNKSKISILDDSDLIADREFVPISEDIVDMQCFHWEVQDWSQLGDRVVGPTMEVGGHKWNLLLFPRGNSQTGHYVSLFLNLVQEDPEEYACAQFSLGISKPSEPTKFIVHTAHHRFTKPVLDWGFDKYTNAKGLLEFMEKDSVRFTTIVRVVKDPTGILWCNMDNYDSKKTTGYVGLQNQGATCYMNSLFQSLYFTNYFRKAVYQIPTEHDEPTNSIALALQRLFYSLQFSKCSVGTQEVTRSFGWDYYEAFRQHDVQEFNRVLQDNLELKMRNTPADGAIKHLFLGRMKSYIKCINVDFESSRSEDYYDIQLNVKGCKNLEESFKDYITEETLEGENKYMAEGHGLQDAKKGVVFESFPPVLHLQLKRFEYDMYTDMMVKINDRHEFPTEIDLEPYLCENADKSKPHNYKLCGVLVHSGDLTSGHYFAFVKPGKEDKWFKFDDDYVLPVTMNNVLEENFGGEQSNLSMSRFTNAYMLVYIRECMEDDIMAPVTETDIPKHLISRFEEEERELKKRRLQIEESHLYQTVIIAKDTSFQNNTGYDIAVFDERYASESQSMVFKVRKDQTFKDFTEGISETYGLRPSDFRLWAMATRQNNTVRLGSVITEEENDTTMDALRMKHTNGDSANLRLYLETATLFDENNSAIFPSLEGDEAVLLLFIKLFVPYNQTIQGIAPIYAPKNLPVKEKLSQLKQMGGILNIEQILIYEEVKPGLIIPVNINGTFADTKLENGDILFIQKKLNPLEEVVLAKSGRKTTVNAYLEYELNKMDVTFAPLSQPRSPDLQLTLHKSMKYEEVSDIVASQLNISDNKLRLINPYINGAQSRFNGLMLGQIAQIARTNKPHILYERLHVSLEEMETKCQVFVTVCSPTIQDVYQMEFLIPKDSDLDYLKSLIVSQLVEDGHSYSEHVRIYDERDGKFNLEFDDAAWREYVTAFSKLYVYAERLLIEEVKRSMSSNCIYVGVFHFQRILSYKHSIPFKFLIIEDEPLAEMRKRLQARIGVPDNEWNKVKLYLVSGDEREAVMLTNDDTVLYNLLVCTVHAMIGLDHIDKKARVDKTGAISIRG